MGQYETGQRQQARHGNPCGERKRKTESQVNIFLKSSNIVKELRPHK